MLSIVISATHVPSGLDRYIIACSEGIGYLCSTSSVNVPFLKPAFLLNLLIVSRFSLPCKSSQLGFQPSMCLQALSASLIILLSAFLASFQDSSYQSLYRTHL